MVGSDHLSNHHGLLPLLQPLGWGRGGTTLKQSMILHYRYESKKREGSSRWEWVGGNCQILGVSERKWN